MKKCIICGEEFENLFYWVCTDCSVFPYGLHLCRKGLKSITFADSIDPYCPNPWPNDEGFKFNQTNWMFFSTIVDRLNEINKPILVRDKTTKEEYIVRSSSPYVNVVHLIKPENIFSVYIQPLKSLPDLFDVKMWYDPDWATPSIDLSKFPQTCPAPGCGSPAYIGGNIIECTNSKCRYYKV
jgi:hypothetical protein